MSAICNQCRKNGICHPYNACKGDRGIEGAYDCSHYIRQFKVDCPAAINFSVFRNKALSIQFNTIISGNGSIKRRRKTQKRFWVGGRWPKILRNSASMDANVCQWMPVLLVPVPVRSAPVSVLASSSVISSASIVSASTVSPRLAVPVLSVPVPPVPVPILSVPESIL